MHWLVGAVVDYWIWFAGSIGGAIAIQVGWSLLEDYLDEQGRAWLAGRWWLSWIPPLMSSWVRRFMRHPLAPSLMMFAVVLLIVTVKELPPPPATPGYGAARRLSHEDRSALASVLPVADEARLCRCDIRNLVINEVVDYANDYNEVFASKRWSTSITIGGGDRTDFPDGMQFVANPSDSLAVKFKSVLRARGIEFDSIDDPDRGNCQWEVRIGDRPID